NRLYPRRHNADKINEGIRPPEPKRADSKNGTADPIEQSIAAAAADDRAAPIHRPRGSTAGRGGAEREDRRGVEQAEEGRTAVRSPVLHPPPDDVAVGGAHLALGSDDKPSAVGGG